MKKDNPEKHIPNFDPDVESLDGDECELAAYEPPLIWSREQIKDHWRDLQNTAESLLSGNAPIIYAFSDLSFILCNWGMVAEMLSDWFRKMHRPNSSEIEDAARKSGLSEEELKAEYLAVVLSEYRRHLSGLINSQYIGKMNEAHSMFFKEAMEQVSQRLNGKKIKTSSGVQFTITCTDREKRALKDFQKRIERKQKLRIGARSPGRQPKHNWTETQKQKFRTQYEFLLPKWKEANSFCKQNKSLDHNMRLELLKLRFRQLPPKLLEQISRQTAIHSGPRLSKEQHEQYGEAQKFVDSLPDFAIQHAAFLIGIQPFTITSRQLRKYLKK